MVSNFSRSVSLTDDRLIVSSYLLDPIFTIVNQFNEFSGPPDEGADIEHSNDIEPTKQWGYQKFDFVKQKLIQYTDTAPKGFLDAVGADGVATGWALDPDVVSQSIAVHLYVDGPYGSGTFIGNTTANISRPDVNQVTGYAGDHGFTFAVPDQYRTGTHLLYAYGINSLSGGTNTILSGSPIKIPAK